MMQGFIQNEKVKICAALPIIAEVMNFLGTFQRASVGFLNRCLGHDAMNVLPTVRPGTDTQVALLCFVEPTLPS